MAQGLLSLSANANASGSAASVVTSNTRVSTATGKVAIQTDIVQFSGPMVTGAWTVAATRCKVNSIPVINQSSTGQAASPSPSTAPMTVTQGDSRVKGS